MRQASSESSATFITDGSKTLGSHSRCGAETGRSWDFSVPPRPRTYSSEPRPAASSPLSSDCGLLVWHPCNLTSSRACSELVTGHRIQLSPMECVRPDYSMRTANSHHFLQGQVEEKRWRSPIWLALSVHVSLGSRGRVVDSRLGGGGFLSRAVGRSTGLLSGPSRTSSIRSQSHFGQGSSSATDRQIIRMMTTTPSSLSLCDPHP